MRKISPTGLYIVRWLSPYFTANWVEMSTNNMKSTWPMGEFCFWDSTRPIFHIFVLVVCIGRNPKVSARIGGNENFSIFRYKHVGIPKDKLLRRGYCPM